MLSCFENQSYLGRWREKSLDRDLESIYGALGARKRENTFWRVFFLTAFCLGDGTLLPWWRKHCDGAFGKPAGTMYSLLSCRTNPMTHRPAAVGVCVCFASPIHLLAPQPNHINCGCHARRHVRPSWFHQDLLMALEADGAYIDSTTHFSIDC